MAHTNQIYVIGHINPDTNSVASAMGYAWLLDDTTESENFVAARAGQLNPQTTWVFERLGLEPPVYLPYPRLDNGTRNAEGVVSRKKQLLPLVLGALEA